MDYPIKILSQLRPILVGFRKSAGLTQAMVASRLGVTQQTYSQLEANPAAASVERLFKVLRVLDVKLTLASATEQVSATERTSATEPPSATERAVATERTSEEEGAEKHTVAATASEARQAGDPGPGRVPGAIGIGGRKRENW